MTSVYDFTVKDIKGKDVALEIYRGKPLLIVNTATKCLFTPQLKGLEALYKENKDAGLVVLGFPCNQFGEQNPESDAGVADFCEMNFQVSFPLFARIDVNGEGAHPLFTYLCEALPGIFGTRQIKWNFTKFFIDKAGVPCKRFGPNENPSALAKVIKSLL